MFGLDFVSDASLQQVVDHLLAGRSDPTGGWQCVVTPNVDHLVRYERHPAEAEVAEHATVVLADGMPIVWASRLLGRPLGERLAGADVFARLWPLLAERDIPAVVLASNDAVAQGLRKDHPGASIVVAPWFDVEDRIAVDALVDRVSDAVEECAADFVVIGVSMPKHHRIAGELRRRWGDRAGGATVLLVGAAPELYLGLERRAPAWMQRSGLEWVYRLSQDPLRLAKRYLVDDVQFLRLVVLEWRSLRRRGTS